MSPQGLDLSQAVSFPPGPLHGCTPGQALPQKLLEGHMGLALEVASPRTPDKTASSSDEVPRGSRDGRWPPEGGPVG